MDSSAEIASLDAGAAPSATAAAGAETEQRQSKRRKTSHAGSSASLISPLAPPASRWRTGYEQRVFASNLLSALRRVRSGESSSSTTPAVPRRSRAVRDASDRILAAAAGGRSRWSRAVLARHRSACRKVRARKAAGAQRETRSGATVLLERERMNKRRSVGENENADLLSKVKVLGSLVPGCRKTSFPSLLEETSDYIAALQMQVRAMSALAEMLTSMGSLAGGSSGAAPSRLS